MAEQFIMPKLGLTMEAGKVVQWLVDDGAEVAAGQAVMLIETDKVESEVESTGAGVLHQVAQVGEEYPCGDPIGWFLAPGEEPPAAAAPAAAAPAATASAGASAAGAATTAAAASGVAAATTSAPAGGTAARGDGGRLLASPNAKRIAGERGIDLTFVTGTGPDGRITSEDVPLTPPAAPAATPAAVAPAMARPAGAPVLATAAGRQLAELLGIDLAAVPSSGPDPRIGREDVAAYVRHLIAGASGAPGAAAPAASSAAAPAMPLLQDPTKLTPLTGMRGTIAERMSGSLASMAQLTLQMDVDMDAVVADRNERKAAGVAPGFTDYVIAAVAAALGDHPYVNSQVTDDGVAELPQVNVGMAVALDEGLIVPVVQNTASLSLDELSAETTRLASAARDGKLKLNDLEGGTFSVTALGMFDVDGFTPIINAPNTAILGVGRLRDDVAWSDDGIPVRAKRLTLSLTWDHRAFDGAPAAEFTRTIKRRLETLDLTA